jgi:dCMP deaminase
VSRPSWDSYFLDIAKTAATRSTCDRAHVGAVLVKDKTLLATGYNGSPRGTVHCDDAGHLMRDMGGRPACIRTVHAEANAVAQAARAGTRVEGATLYVTHLCCYDCAKLVVNAGIIRIVYGEVYPSRFTEETLALFREARVTCQSLAESENDIKVLVERKDDILDALSEAGPRMYAEQSKK